MSPSTNQAGTEMIKLSQLNLQLAFVGARSLGKNVENQTRTVNHTTPELTLEITFLTGCEHVVEYDQVTLMRLNQRLKLFNLATADQKPGTGLMPVDGQKGSNLGSSRIGQLNKFLRIFPGALFCAFKVNKQGPLTAFMTFKEQSSLRTNQGFSNSSSSLLP
jgi:hypothetical protein